MMGPKRDSSGGFKSTVPKLLLACLLTAILAGAGTHAAVLNQNKQEAESVELFWNGYAGLYYDQNGSWSGLDERLRRDRFILAQSEHLGLALYDVDLSAPIASYKTSKRDAEEGRRIAVMSNGQIVGYSEAFPLETGLWDLRAAIAAVGAALLVWLGHTCWLTRQRHLMKSVEQNNAAAILKLLAQDQTERLPSPSLDKPAAEQATVQQAPSELMREVHEQVGRLTQRVEQLETVRRRMVADISHELRTPIAIMRTQLENAIQEEHGLEWKQAMLLHDETLHLTKLVRDLQELSMAEAGNLPLEKSWFSLALLAEGVAETLAVGATDPVIQVAMKIDNQVMIYADEKRIRQVLINVIGNGLRHARSVLEIEVGLSSIHGEAVVTVSDDGLGMEEEELDFVFERFYRGSTHHTGSRKSGLGLGLAIARQLSLAHGGTLSVESAYGQGAVFTLVLPVMSD